MRKKKSRQRKLRTDTGTVILHWMAVVAIGANLITGLAIAADAQQRSWLRMLRDLLPQGDVWSLHVWSALFLLAIVAAYPTYIRRSGLAQRVRLDKARLHALRIRGRARWGAINVMLYWLVFALLLIQVGTGTLLYLGHGGVLVSIHYCSAILLIIYPIAHVLAQYAYGHFQQVLRIFQPGPLIDAPRPPGLAELVRQHLERTGGRRSLPTRRTLQVHPLSVAGAIAVASAALATSIDLGTRDKLVIRAILSAEAPTLDGDLADPIWRKAAMVTIDTQQGANFGGSGASKVTARALHDGTWIYFAFTWDDPTRSLKHLPLIKRADGWHLLHTRYDIEDEDSYYEDKFSVMLADSSQMPAAGAIHLGPRPLADKPPAISGRGLHFTTDGSVVDVWHWKAARGGLLGWMDDNYFGPPAAPTGEEEAGKSRYKGGYKADPGKAFFANNFDQQAPGGYTEPIRPKRLPKDLAALKQAMGTIDLDPDSSEATGARWWMMDEESAPYSPEADARIPVGTVIPGVLIAGGYSGDRADVRCAAQWSAGRWTLEVARRLDTGSKHDVAIRTGVSMWVAAFDHSQTRHTRHLRPIKLEVAQ